MSELQKDVNPQLKQFFGGDSDNMLVMILLAVLMNENADRSLILALLYILFM